MVQICPPIQGFNLLKQVDTTVMLQYILVTLAWIKFDKSEMLTRLSISMFLSAKISVM